MTLDVDGRPRCSWCLQKGADYLRYHDTEWGVPVHDDRTHFEFLVLESAQAGLSWATVLRRRDGYRLAFADFDPHRVARFTERRVARLAEDTRIIRNRQKIVAAVNNARRFLEVQVEFGSFDRYLWGFVNGRTICNRWRHEREVPATSPESDALGRDLKQRGFQFVGSTICYAHMQAAGLVNDHVIQCFRHAACLAAGSRT